VSLANYIPTFDDYMRFLPEIILVITGTLIMFLEAALAEGKKGMLASLALVGLAAALAGSIASFAVGGLGFSNMVIVDGFATFFRVLVIAVGILTIFASTHYLRQERANAGEYYALVVFSVVGPVRNGHRQ
jgi:NADH-quinone oxidoreductase subunit N